MLRRATRVLPSLDLPLVIVLTGINALPADVAKKVIEARGQERAEQRSHPVDPVVSGETAVDDVRAEGAGGV
jgi:hypothetical protein